MADRLGRLDLPFEFFSAIDGSELPPARLKHVYSPNRTFMRMGRYLHPNEIGCALSHTEVWAQMVREETAELLVLEDDVELAEDVPMLLATRYKWIPANARIVYLAHHMAEPVGPTPIDSNYGQERSICTFSGPVMSAAAYLIRKPAALSLLAHSIPLRMPVDDLLGRPEFTGGGIYGVVPKPVTWNDNHPSTIWVDTQREDFASASRSGLGGVVRRTLRRIIPRRALPS
jgi:glycosyl transferase family 25